MFKIEAVQKILDISESVELSPEKMAELTNVVFYPSSNEPSQNVKFFLERLKHSFLSLGVNIVPVDQCWETVPFFKRASRFAKYVLNDLFWLSRKCLKMPEVNFYLSLKTILKLAGSKRIKRGVAIICTEQTDHEKLPMQFIANFKTNSVITVLDFPRNIDIMSSFDSHFNTAMSLFAYHMTNIILAVDDKKWMVYNFNASHPIYEIKEESFNKQILSAVIPKIIAPISPHRLSDFIVLSTRFKSGDELHKSIIDEMKIGSRLFDKTQLYPKGKRIDDLPFRTSLHKLIGKLHLDNRSGMSFGFFAHQMPTALSLVGDVSVLDEINKTSLLQRGYFTDDEENIFVGFNVKGKEIYLKVPDVWVMTLRSGSDKTDFDEKKDLLKIGLVRGKMYMQLPEGLKIDHDYKPSFDTKVILAHAVGNGIVGSILNYIYPENSFSSHLEKTGVAISHWHGYFNESKIPPGIVIYGKNNPHVSCSSPQSAIYALEGKIEKIFDIINRGGEISSYVGDIHIEPHHGININYPSLSSLAQYILSTPDSTALGNKYLG